MCTSLVPEMINERIPGKHVGQFIARAQPMFAAVSGSIRV